MNFNPNALPSLAPSSCLSRVLRSDDVSVEISEPGCFEPATVLSALREFVANEVLEGDADGLDEFTPLLEWGIIDSLVMINLLTFIEDTWGIQVPDEDVKPEYFADLDSLTRFLFRREAMSQQGQLTSTASIHDSMLQSLETYGVRRGQIEVGDAQMHFLEVLGDGPTWILLPALGNPASSWGAMMQTMSGERHVVALDLAGFGLSKGPTDAPTYADHLDMVTAAIDALSSGPVVLVGNSAGSMLAAEYARTFPQRVKALVVTSFGAIDNPREWWAGVEELGRDPDRFLEEVYYQPPKLSRKLRTLLDETLERPAYASFLDDDALDAMPSMFDGVRVPTLFVSGQTDRVIPQQSVEAAARAIPGARLEWLARCGHFPHAERPQELLHLIDLFLGSSPTHEVQGAA